MTTVEKVIYFITNEYFDFTPTIKINEYTRLREDLDIEGDDAIEFLERIESKFDVNFKDLDFTKYFHSEGFNPFTFFFYFFFTKKESIRVIDIAKSIEAGKWIDPSNNKK